MTGGFALVAWPSEYDVTGIMTFIVSAAGPVWQRDFGPATATSVNSLTTFDPSSAWSEVR
jgi:hypothetical protein